VSEIAATSLRRASLLCFPRPLGGEGVKNMKAEVITMSELIKKMLEAYPGTAFPDNEASFVAAAEKLGFATPDINAALLELSQMMIDDESLDAISGGMPIFPSGRQNTRR
jgi:hypothetical protein